MRHSHNNAWELDLKNLTFADFDSDGTLEWLVGSYREREDNLRLFRATAATRQPTGDVNLDGVVDAAGVGLLCRAISRGSVDAAFDLDRNQAVDLRDIERLITESLGTVFGDANLDGRFDTADLMAVFSSGL